MKEQQIARLLVHARSHTSRARVLLRNGDREQALKHTQRAERALAVIKHARTVAAVSQFIK